MAVLFVVPGNLEGVEAIGIRKVFERLATSDDDIALDMSGVERIDCSGLGVLTFLMKRVRSQGYSVELRNPSEALARQLMEVGVTGLFQPVRNSSGDRSVHIGADEIQVSA